MTKEELIEFLKKNLSIQVDQVTEYGPVEEIKVTLYLGDEVIDYSSCVLPEKD